MTTCKSPVRPENLEGFLVAAMQTNGLPEADARTTARVFVTNDTWGVYTHGSKQIRGLLKNYRDGRMSLTDEPVIERDGPGSALIDARQTMPAVVSVQAMELAVAKARKTGIAFVAVRNSGHYGGAGYYAHLAAEQGMIGMSFTNVDPGVTVPGARVPLLGTNPIGYAIPTNKEPTVMMDIATSVVAASKIYALRELGKAIPEGWIIDKEGLPTTNPEGYPAVGALLPMAGHKGYGIGLLIEVLTGVIAGGAFGEQVVSWVLEDPTPVNQSHSFLAIDVSHYLDATDFRNRMDELVRFIRNAPRAKGAERIYLPGELEWDARVAALEHGMMLPDHVMVRLEGLSLDTGIPLETIYG
jgi:LDH2 family malate/lactate/ureidoglycolate dehydrogenase